MIAAALFVHADGVYARRPDVDLWPEARDARKYGGPLPVVAHPPCGAWGFAARRWRPKRVGEDGGCFAAALEAVTRWGGVLEHPAGSSAWERFGLTRPGGWGWTPAKPPAVSPDGAPVTGGLPGSRHWTCSIDQGSYGHPCPKRTWLYLVTPVWVDAPPPVLVWGPSGAPGRVVEMGRQVDRETTPVEFAELLLSLAPGQRPGVSPAGGDDVCELPSCGKLLEQTGRGPRRRFCDCTCRQRASRQRRAGGVL